MKVLLGQSKIKSAHISYVPELLPDELIYSWIGRLISVNALGCPKDCLEQLFGNRYVIPSIDLPTLLTDLQKNLGNNSPFNSAAQLLKAGTLYPYHRPFLTRERDQSIRKIMFHTDGKGLKMLMGRVANRFGANPPLRFCDICVKEDTKIFGTPYWKRHHQLPGVNCCLKHRIHLEKYISPDLIVDRQHYILPPYLQSHEKSANTSTSQLDFAVLSKDLLHADLPSITPEIRKHIYSEAVIATGCYSRLHRIDYANLSLRIKDYYNDFSEFTHQQRLLSSLKQPLCWLHTLIERPERSSHPICHLLLIGYLFRNIHTFVKLINSYNRHDNFSMIEFNDANDTKSAMDDLIIDTSLSCRQVAKLLNLSTTTVVCKRRQLNVPIKERRKTLNIKMINSIRQDLSSGLLIQEIALRNKVSVSTVYRLRAESTGLFKFNSDYNQKLGDNRKWWLHLILDNPNTGSTSLRAIAPATYAWLYRHDKVWLTNINLKLKPIKITKQRVNWIERDFNLSKQLTCYVAEIKKLGDRPRISKTLMLRVVGDAMVRRNLYRLPTLDNQLQEMVESQFEYQIFRIDQAINTLLKISKPLRQSYIQRKSNIKKWTPDLETYARQRVKFVGVHL